MAQAIYKGRTNNWVGWTMVDATDFATPESALSAATKIKIWGMRRGSTSTSLISSGAGSLTNDIIHVGPSVLGQYAIALAKADISSTNAYPWDLYMINLSATGAAYQTLMVEGKYDDGSYVSNVLSYLSNMESNLSGVVSDIRSDVSDMHSDLIVMSGILSDAYSLMSDFQSDFQSRVPKRVATDSQLSDMASDLKSYLAVMSGVQSDIYSLLSDHHSDFQSRVPKAVATNSQLSDLQSDLKSYLAVMSGVQSDIYSLLSDHHSDFQSRVPKLVANNSQLSDLASDLKSAIGAITVTLDASNISDIASAVVAALPITSMVSDIYSLLSDHHSDFQSRIPKRVATDSQLSDLASDIKSYLAGMSAAESDIYSLLTANRAEPGQGAPGATLDPLSKIDYLYKAMRNRQTQSSQKWRLYNDDATTIGQSTTVSDDGTTFDRGEIGTGA